VQELGEREHSHTDSQAGQRTLAVPWTLCSAYEWELVRGWEAIGSSLSQEFESSLVWEFGLFGGI